MTMQGTEYIIMPLAFSVCVVFIAHSFWLFAISFKHKRPKERDEAMRYAPPVLLDRKVEITIVTEIKQPLKTPIQ